MMYCHQLSTSCLSPIQTPYWSRSCCGQSFSCCGSWLCCCCSFVMPRLARKLKLADQLLMSRFLLLGVDVGLHCCWIGRQAYCLEDGVCAGGGRVVVQQCLLHVLWLLKPPYALSGWVPGPKCKFGLPGITTIATNDAAACAGLSWAGMNCCWCADTGGVTCCSQWSLASSCMSWMFPIIHEARSRGPLAAPEVWSSSASKCSLSWSWERGLTSIWHRSFCRQRHEVFTTLLFF